LKSLYLIGLTEAPHKIEI